MNRTTCTAGGVAAVAAILLTTAAPAHALTTVNTTCPKSGRLTLAVATANVNIRKAPTTKSASLGILPKGRKAVGLSGVYGERGDWGWSKITTPYTGTGYVNEAYIDWTTVKCSPGKRVRL